VIAIDTNILVYARRAEAPHHRDARRLLTTLAEGDESWALPWPCVYEYLRVVTHPRVFDPPTPLEDALEDLESLLTSPSLSLLGEGPTHVGRLLDTVSAGGATGNLVHDAHIAALVLEHGAREFWTTDRDFRRFPGLVIRDPFDKAALHDRKRRYRKSTPRRGMRSR
jgi:toxin-antitoxin system PIN domain toxin